LVNKSNEGQDKKLNINKEGEKKEDINKILNEVKSENHKESKDINIDDILKEDTNQILKEATNEEDIAQILKEKPKEIPNDLINEILNENKSEKEKEKEKEIQEKIKKEDIKEDKKEKEEEKKENIKKAIKNEESNENMRYIKGIFKYIKTKINFGIIVVDSGNCYKPQNIQILKEIYKVINDVKDLDNVPKDKLEGKPIYDYLFVLNKIDTSHDKNKTIQECRNYFVNSIEPHLFNIEFCTFAPISSIQLRNEMLMKDHLENYFRYFFNKYIDKYVTTKNTETTQGNEDETPNIDFIN
jgi:hypothetical protein